MKNEIEINETSMKIHDKSMKINEQIYEKSMKNI